MELVLNKKAWQQAPEKRVIFIALCKKIVLPPANISTYFALAKNLTICD